MIFNLSIRLAPPLFKIARLIAWWRYAGASVYIEIDIIFIFLQKIFESLNSIAENLIIGLTIGKTMCICEIYFSQIGFYLAHFHEEIQWKSQTFSRALPQTPPGLYPGLAGGLTALPPNPQQIIAIAARSFSQNSKKTRPANFSLFRPLLHYINAAFVHIALLLLHYLNVALFTVAPFNAVLY